MAFLPQALVSKSLARLVCLVSLTPLFFAGCVVLDRVPGGKEKPPTGKPCQMVTTWQPRVVYAADPAHNGRMTPGVAGRMYFFGGEIGTPMACEGCLVVDLYELPAVAGQESQLREQWRIDSETLTRLLKKDTIGWGYTLFLPWSSYSADVRQIQLKARFEPVVGTPLFSQSDPMSVDPSTGLPGGAGGSTSFTVGKPPK